ncbi:hypothetical protein BDZ45DRAFT_410947 [Acephala macrosclerotiorum]|nr:hypothetical protein BDZ45DRAFT_410947 [Acephala macrosclerotiorum]
MYVSYTSPIESCACLTSIKTISTPLFFCCLSTLLLLPLHSLLLRWAIEMPLLHFQTLLALPFCGLDLLV